MGRSSLATTLLATLILLIGAMTMIGWIFHIPGFLQVAHEFVPVVFNTGACLFLSALILISLTRTLGYQQSRVSRGLLIFILAFALLSLSQDIFHYRLGIDEWVPASWLYVSSVVPGRMSPSTDLCFIASSLLGLSLPFGHKRWVAIFIQVCTVFIIFVALLSLMFYSLDLQFIFLIETYTRMSIQSALGFLILGFGWWSIWMKTTWCRKFYSRRKDKKILVILGLILSGLTLVLGVGGLISLTHVHLSGLNSELQVNVKHKVSTIEFSVKNAREETLNLTRSPAVLLALEDPKLHRQEKRLLDELVAKDFSAVFLEDAAHQEVFTYGKFSKPVFKVFLRQAVPTTLFWAKNGFWLNIKMPMVKDRKIIGFLMTETPLDAMTTDYLAYNALGKTGELRLCQSTTPDHMVCFPSRFYSRPYSGSYLYHGEPIPIGLALRGGEGVVSNVPDYLGHAVVAAYAPVGNLNLALVNKMDKAEIYEPLRHKLLIIFPLAFILIALGLWLVYWQVHPLVRAVFVAQKKLGKSNLQLEVSLQELNQRNQEISLLRELNSALQLCDNTGEAAQVVSNYALKLLPDFSGILYFFDKAKDVFEPLTHWGEWLAPFSTFPVSACWGVRHGDIFKVENAKTDLHCEHVQVEKEGKNFAYLCIPILMQETTIGLLYLQTSREFKEEINEKIELIRAFNEQIALSFYSIILRDTLRQQAFLDSLTGLHNRRFLNENLDREIERSARENQTLAVLMMDIDHFKNINDTFGHDVGDEVLKALAQLIRQHIRLYDLACRYGGEEFTIVLLDLDRDAAIHSAERLCEAIRKLKISYDSDKTLDHISVSIGVSFFPKDGLQAQMILHAADQALYRAKEAGRGRVVVFS